MKSYIVGAAVIMLCMGGLYSCKKFPDPGLLIEEYKKDSTIRGVSNQRKLLLINIDGLNAEVLQAVKPPSIQGLLANAKYSFTTNVNLPINNTSAWGSMYTGNFETRMWDSTFYAVPVDTTNTIPVPLNLTAFRYVHDVYPGKKIAAVADWPNLVNTLFADADKKLIATNDADTKTKVANLLKSDNADVVCARFSSVQQAGAAFGYAPGTAYEAAIKNVDSYVGDIMTALKSRPGYKDEKWLTLITTTQVSDTLLTTKNWDSAAVKIPGFFIAHYAGFSSQDITKLNPVIIPRNEDVAAILLYWLSVAKPSTLSNGSSWLDRFELEFLTK
ncbi:alkaline phosphatase family protein [Niabella beijingensis]|uniref:alkaline phosphatase family protein n=1 Tax=Niabella beijingensis TaxID=2872700 RepID=UPI001CBAF2C2|nr:alkaline phosphatase family protein [Niabella beijingensis]MBZ4191046.1 alkaline phosphatase family protein [Niabella beijingensis]